MFFLYPTVCRYSTAISTTISFLCFWSTSCQTISLPQPDPSCWVRLKEIIHMNTAHQQCWLCNIILVSYAHQGCIYLIKNTVKHYFYGILLQFQTTVLYFNILLNVIYSCDGKTEFSAAITPVCSVTWFLGLKKHCLLLSIIYVTLDHKTSHKGTFFEIELNK